MFTRLLVVEQALTVTAHTLLQIPYLGHGWVLATGAQEIAEAIEHDTSSAALVEEREGLLVVGRSLRVVRVRRHFVT